MHRININVLKLTYKTCILLAMEIIVENLRKNYSGTTVLDIPSLTIHSGEIVSLVGNNGAGKTTFLRLVLDLIKADSGCVISNGQPTNNSVEWKNYTGSFIDGRFLIDFFTPEEYFSFIAKVYGIDKTTLANRLDDYTALMNGEILGKKKYLRNHSEGNRQKVGIIGAMFINPKVLILDEPFNYLDPSSQIIAAQLIKQMNEKLGTTVIVSSHNLTSVTEISSRVLLLEKGKIIKDIANVDGCAAEEMKSYFSHSL